MEGVGLMLATQIRQKDSVFYFVSYPAEDLLGKVRFISRFYADGDKIQAEEIPAGDEVASFIARIEQTDAAFQRELSKAKVTQIENFYETAQTQPPIPGTVLLFTPEALTFESIGRFESVGDLQEPRQKYLIIDGQHRLAALHFFRQHRPEDAATIHVPCVIFDGKSEDFATEMFVIINSTPTRINKSHLVDLYERISWAAPDRKFAARVVDKLYRDDDSPLQYKINRLGGRSKQKKWILQAELFNELYRWVKADWKTIKAAGGGRAANVQKFYDQIRDFFKAAEKVWGDTWGHANYMVTRPVTLKAMIRVNRDLVRADPIATPDRVKRWQRKLSPWGEMMREFRADGFYERFPARGQVERVARIHRELGRAARIDSVERKRKKA
jgi:DGQHR domain-containing protein